MKRLRMCLALVSVLFLESRSDAKPHRVLRSAPPPVYRLRILPLAEVSGINDKGQVIGIRYPKTPYEDSADIYSKSYLSYVWEKDRLRSLGAASTHPRILATAINNRGIIVGTEEDVTAGPFPFTLGDAYLWTRGRKDGLTPLALSRGRADATFAAAINSKGTIVGSSGMAFVMDPEDSENWSHAVVWSRDKVTDLGWGEAKDINDRGQVVGISTTFADQFEDHATLWDHGQKTVIGDGTANAINSRGQVVGALGNGRAFLYDHGKMTDLGKCDGIAINDRGQVLLDGDWNESSHAVYLWQKGRRWDIDRFVPEFTRWSGLTVSGINNKGAIIGYGTYQGQERAFLLVPQSPARDALAH